MELLLRKYGNVLDVTTPDLGPTPVFVRDLLTPLLQYEHKRVLRGEDRYGPDGTVRNIDIEIKYLYQILEGRVTTGFGMYGKIVDTLRPFGYSLKFVDLSPPRERPRCYEPDWNHMCQYINFRPRQDECLAAMMHYPCGVINAPTGFGKTHTMGAFCHLYPHAKIDIVVRGKDVAFKIHRRLTKDIPNVGMIGGGQHRRGDRVTVYTAGSVHHSPGDADFLLGDEVHQLVAPDVQAKLADKYLFTRNYGFTATPEGRMDNAHAQLESFFGRQIFVMTYEEAVALGLVVPIMVRWLPIHLRYNPAAGKRGTPRDRWGIWRNQERNQAIATDARQYSSDHQVLILTNTVDHAVHLWRELPEFALCYGVMKPAQFETYKRAHLLPQSFQLTDAARREQMKVDFEEQRLKKVIATDVWATGVDFEALPTCYRVDSRESEILDAQAPGRTSRVSEGKSYGEVVDCYDSWDNHFKRKSETRRRHYRKMKWSQQWPNSRSHFANYG